MLNVALTHDVDRTFKSYQYLTHLTRAVLKRDVRNATYHLSSFFKKNPYWNFDKIIQIENQFDVKSTFFFLNESIKFNPLSISDLTLSAGRYDIQAPDIVCMIKWLNKSGWEIGLHGSYNSFKDRQLLLKEKKILENIVGHEIYGVRQHYLNLNDKTWRIQKGCGLKYDASYGFTDNIGFKDNQISPFRPFDDDFLVFPLAVMDSCYFSRENRLGKLTEIIETVRDKDALLVINWHQRHFNEREFPGYLKGYVRMLEKFKEMEARFYTLKEFYTKKNILDEVIV